MGCRFFRAMLRGVQLSGDGAHFVVSYGLGPRSPSSTWTQVLIEHIRRSSANRRAVSIEREHCQHRRLDMETSGNSMERKPDGQQHGKGDGKHRQCRERRPL